MQQTAMSVHSKSLQELVFRSHLMWVRRIGHITLVPRKGFESLGCFVMPFDCHLHSSSGYPQAAAADVALSTVRDFLEKNPGLVRWIMILVPC
jgi:hypothetical protein